MKIWQVFTFIACLPLFASAQYQLKVLDTLTYTTTNITTPIQYHQLSFRGMSVVNEKVVWVSGNQSVVGRSTDGGQTFTLVQIQGYPDLELRAIKALDKDAAIVVSSGSPGYIFKTFDGGISWRKVFEDNRPEIFLDAVDFWDKDKGVVIGDPIDRRFVLFKTLDGGNTWHPFDTAMRPWAVNGESLFAASGTSFKCMPKGSIGFVTGGSVSVMHWLQIDKKYQRFELKSMQQGKNSQGAFSFDFNKNSMLIVGGDYASDTTKTKQGAYSYKYSKDGLELLNMKPFYSGYRSCVSFIGSSPEFISCGTNGVDVNNLNRIIVHPTAGKGNISEESFHVVQSDKTGKLVVLAGSKGKIAILTQ